jgi:hypothetical protein
LLAALAAARLSDLRVPPGNQLHALKGGSGWDNTQWPSLLRERRAVSPEIALRLGKLFGTSPEFWLNLQRNVDLWDAARGLRREIAHIDPLQVA